VIVADTNLIGYMLIDGEQTGSARKVWTRDPDWAMPPLWRSEFLNVLVVAHRAGALDRQQVVETWRRSTLFMNATELEPDGEQVLKIALDRDLSAYDAQFVTVATELGVPLVTADQRVLDRCPDIAVSIHNFAHAC
jgi:predicted nucleic acid-binding protein